MKSEYIQIIVAISGIIGVLLGYLIKYILDKNSEIISSNNKVKRDIYKKFISMMFDLFSSEKSQERKNTELKSTLLEFYKDYVLYASPAVINAFSDYMQYLYKNSEKIDAKESMYKLAKIISAMRSELGLSNKGLDKDGINLFRAYFKDFDKIK